MRPQLLTKLQYGWAEKDATKDEHHNGAAKTSKHKFDAYDFLWESLSGKIIQYIAIYYLVNDGLIIMRI